MGYLDNNGLSYFWGKVRAALSGKQDTLAAGDGITIADNTVNVENPVKGVLTKQEFDALPEEERNKGLYIIKDSSGGSGGGGIPTGGIIIWSGSEVPDGWALCDGTNDTPDLRDRFVLGEGTLYSRGNTGGSKEVTLSTENLPSHTHGYSYSNVTLSGNNGGSLFDGGTSNINASSTSGTTSSTGNSQAFSIMPPYYVLAYIMKL